MTNFGVKQNWIHFIGIGGVTTGPLAVKFLEKGFYVTGTDPNLYDPIKSYLKNFNIKIFKQFSYSNLLNEKNEVPSLIVVGSGVSLKNKEFKFAKLHSLNYKHFPEILQDKVIVDNSIVVAGTYGKTTITAMLVEIFKKAKKEISYMFGGQLVSGKGSLKFKNLSTKFSIVEGDEYISARFDQKSKFFYYNPKYLVLTSLKWDHTDIFKTHKEYIENFENLINTMPDDGLIFANQEDKDIKNLAKNIHKKFIFFDKQLFQNLQKKYDLKLKVLGEYNLQNALVSIYVAEYFGIKKEIIKMALENFSGIKRRLEVRYNYKNQTLIIDDFASTPAKVEGSLKSLKKIFPKYKIIVVFEPNFGSRTEKSLPLFKKALKDNVDLLLLPKFTQVKQEEINVDENVMKNYLKSDLNIDVIIRQDELIKFLIDEKKQHKNIVYAFLSSHENEKLIQETINQLKNYE